MGYKVDNIKASNKVVSFIAHFEVIPLCIALGIEVVLKNQVINFVLDLYLSNCYFVDSEKVSRLKARIKDQIVIAHHSFVLWQL